MTARVAGEAMARGLNRAFTDAHIDVVPVADGGDGTAEVLVDALGGRLEIVSFSAEPRPASESPKPTRFCWIALRVLGSKALKTSSN